MSRSQDIFHVARLRAKHHANLRRNRWRRFMMAHYRVRSFSVSLVLVACMVLGIGGSFAYLISQSNTLNNNFEGAELFAVYYEGDNSLRFYYSEPSLAQVAAQYPNTG